MITGDRRALRRAATPRRAAARRAQCAAIREELRAQFAAAGIEPVRRSVRDEIRLAYELGQSVQQVRILLPEFIRSVQSQCDAGAPFSRSGDDRPSFSVRAAHALYAARSETWAAVAVSEAPVISP